MLVSSIFSFSRNLFKSDFPRGSSYFPKQQILNSSTLTEFADDSFRFDENGRKFSERVENTVWKREIARYGQFLLFQMYFQKACTGDTKNKGLSGK